MGHLGFRSLLTPGENNPKTAKGKDSDYYTVIQHFAHANTAGLGTVCASASPACIATCLDDAGHGKMKMVKRVRAARTKFFRQDKEAYFEMLISELNKYRRKADKLGKMLAARLNGTSDIVWERIADWLFTKYADVQFYDYTKHYKRCMKSYALPDNYHLTFSRSELNDKECRQVLKSGKCNVAVVYADATFPVKQYGRPVYSMDETDLRFLDPPGQVGALYHKGSKKDLREAFEAGFVLPTATYKGE